MVVKQERNLTKIWNNDFQEIGYQTVKVEDPYNCPNLLPREFPGLDAGRATHKEPSVLPSWRQGAGSPRDSLSFQGRVVKGRERERERERERPEGSPSLEFSSVLISSNAWVNYSRPGGKSFERIRDRKKQHLFHQPECKIS